MSKNIKIIIVLLVLILIGFLTFEKKISYDKYAKIDYGKTFFNINEYNVGDTILINFKIKNISQNPFYIKEIKSDDDIDFGNTRIKKIIDTNQESLISIKFILESQIVNKDILIESNSDKGSIKLKIIKNK